jgi:hypothetical protein
MIDIAGRHPMWLTDGVVGRDEKNLVATSGLGLSHSISREGSEWVREAAGVLSLNDALSLHINNAEDSAIDVLTLVSAAVFNMDFLREPTSNLSLTDFAHASLDGYHVGDLSLHTTTSAGAISEGAPVYVSSTNTVDTANASPTPSADACFPIGFANSTTTGSSQDIEVLTEGHIELTDWTAVAGTTNLVAGAKYKLATTAGMITATAPTGNGEHVVRVGVAITTKVLDIEISRAVVI